MERALTAAATTRGATEHRKLPRGSRVIGVLHAADRAERVFERSGVAPLGSPAARGVLAIDNARRPAETRLERVGRPTGTDRSTTDRVLEVRPALRLDAPTGAVAG